MPVKIHRRAEQRVTEQLLDEQNRHPWSQQQRRAPVPLIVEALFSYPGRVAQLVEETARVSRIDGRADRRREDVSLVVPSWTGPAIALLPGCCDAA